MDKWRNRLESDPIPWLLEPENPSVRYATLIDLLGRAANDPEVHELRASFCGSSAIQAIAAGQRRDGGWGSRDYYVPKGMATFWRLTLLGDLGMTLQDNCDLVRTACEFMFRHQDPKGLFRRVHRGESRVVREQATVPCTQARIVRALIQMGYGDDPRTKRAIGWLVHTQRDDGAWLCSGSNPRRGCLRATIDYVRAMELYAPMKKNAATRRAAEFIAPLLLQPKMGRFHVSEAWTQLEFPYFNYSLIPTLLALLGVGMPSDHPSITPAVQYVLERQRDDGTFAPDFVPRSPGSLAQVGVPNKWLTLDALRLIKLSCP